MIHNKRIVAAFLLAVVILGNSVPAAVFAQRVTGENPLGGMSEKLDKLYEISDKKTHMETGTMSLLSIPVTIPDHIAISKCQQSVNIRSGPGTNYTIIGQFPKDAAGIVLDRISDGWVYLKSGDVYGYVYDKYLYLNEKGYEKAKSLYRLTATVTANHLNVRTRPTTITNNNIITEVSKNVDLTVTEEPTVEVVTKNDPLAYLWVKVEIDDHEGYVSKEYVALSYKFKTAILTSSVETTKIRTAIINEAKKHLGLKYVWGGTSLTTGADCSGFIWSVYQKCGIDVNEIGMPRTSALMAKSGKKVTLQEIQPGDLVFYGDKTGKVDHVALYIGNGQVIHESGKKDGCKISMAGYRTILAIRSFLN